ncbi:MAG TPA: hypothetical protein VKH44_00100, partial [Pirellulaceae bacterium]|nr:hypothetical protein [Pirellulaceae bacterium]
MQATSGRATSARATSARATSAVVLAIDRLGAGWLGPYGNTWLETPNFNRLAASSVLCETVVAESPDLSASYRSCWTGRHALEPSSEAWPLLHELAAKAGFSTALVTDE